MTAGSSALSLGCFLNHVRSGTMSAEDFLDEAVALEFDAVELCDLTIDATDPSKTLLALEQRSLRCSTAGIRSEFTESSVPLADAIDYARRWLDASIELGAETIRLVLGAHRVYRTSCRRIEAALDELVARAGSAGAHLAVETHWGLSNDPEYMSELIDRYGKDVLGVCLDWGNMSPDNRRVLVEEFAGLTTHVHVKATAFRNDGSEKNGDLEFAIGVLLRTGYRGTWTIEYEGPPPYREGIAKTRAALERRLSLQPV